MAQDPHADAVAPLRLLTRDTVRAEALGVYTAQDVSGAPNLLARYSVLFGPVTEILFLQAIGPDLTPPAPPFVINPAMLESRQVEWLHERAPHRPADPSIGVLELRTYEARVGHGARFLELMLAALPIRQRYSANFGVWETLSGRRERVLHLWGYRDLAERTAVRAQLRGDDAWTAYTETILPMLATLTSTLLQPLGGA